MIPTNIFGQCTLVADVCQYVALTKRGLRLEYEAQTHQIKGSHMTSRYDSVIEKFAKDKNIEADKGHFSIGECNICGTLALTEVDSEKPRGFDLVELGRDCPNCTDVQRRSPETFFWVLNTLARMRHEMMTALAEKEKS